MSTIDTLVQHLKALAIDFTSTVTQLEAATTMPPAPPAPAPEPPAPPPPAPAPEPPPPPPSQPPAQQVLPQAVAINPSAHILFTDYQGAEQAYTREQSLLEADGATLAVGIRGTSSQLYDRALFDKNYTLLLNGKPAMTIAVASGAKRATFNVDISGLAEGWHVMTVQGDSGVETCVPWCFYRFTSATGKPQAVMPAIDTSHAFSNSYQYAKVHMASVPAVFNPTLVPLAPRETPAFSDSTTTRTTLVQTDLCIWREANLMRTRVTRGVRHPFNQEPYYWATLAANRYPAAGGLDGPRGRGSIAMCTHLQPGRTSSYFCDPWRFGKLEADGYVRTLAGYRLKPDAPRLKVPYTDAQILETLELVGDWSAIKDPKRWGFHEAWGHAWDERTLLTNESAQPIPNGAQGLEKPHLTGPTWTGPVGFIADAQMNRIVRLQHDAASHEKPVKVTEFLTDLAEPWDCVCSEGVLYVSERKAHRIAAYDATTGAFLRVVVQGSGVGAMLDPASRFVRRTAPVATIRTQDVALPEGLFLQDGWLYYGSIAMGQVRRVNLKTGEIKVAVPDIKEYSAGGTNFCKIAVSDGTFGPRGTVFFVTWSIANQGRPRAFLPDGVTEWPWAGVGAGASGPGRPWETMGYGCAVGVGAGKLLAGYSAEGVTMHSKALPTDVTLKDPDTTRRYSSNDMWRLVIQPAYEAAGFCLTHGPGGYGYYGLPLPWGISENIDTYLQAYGHVRP